MRYPIAFAAALLAVASVPAFATVFATVHGVVHDPQHRPISGANVALKSTHSEFTLTAKTTSEGEFELAQAPIGVYRSPSPPPASPLPNSLNLASGTNPSSTSRSRLPRPPKPSWSKDWESSLAANRFRHAHHAHHPRRH